MKMTERQKKLAEDNMRLAYKISWGFRDCGIEQEELQSLALFGLVKAAALFDESRGLKFSTYALPAIRNEILQELQRRKRRKSQLSLDEEIQVPDRTDPVTLADMIPCEESGFQLVEHQDLIPSLAGKARLTNREMEAVNRVVLLGEKQREAAERMGAAQSTINRYVKSGVEKIRRIYFRGKG